MKLFTFLFVISFFILGCATTSKTAIAKPSELANGNLGVRLQMSAKDNVAEGSVISAYNEKCLYRSGGRDRIDRRNCRKDTVGSGKVILLTPENIATVEFERGTNLTEDTQFEISKAQ